MTKLNDILKRLEGVEALATAKLAQPDALDNVERRVLYSDLDLIQLDLEEAVIASSQPAPANVQSAYTRIGVLLQKLKLVPIQRPRRWWTPLEVILRFVGVTCSFTLVGLLFSLPLLFMRAIDKTLQLDPFEYRSEYLKRSIAWFFMFQSGIEADVQGLEKNHFKANCVLMTFTHASNLDGFLVAGTCPIRQLAFGKKELFVVPFFSWISLAFGGVPVDRNNRDRAVQALKRSTDAAKYEKLCIAIAPEGTRSLTGQVLPFKKGQFAALSHVVALMTPDALRLLFRSVLHVGGDAGAHRALPDHRRVRPVPRRQLGQPDGARDGALLEGHQPKRGLGQGAHDAPGKGSC
jgi:1-acyl-sn-glycerol-3-phosphate acyltransferase